ncbi:MAG: ABC transporter ATP-binding protein [Chromatiales bacterium]|nr:ABC transporter ATP-binding protein [Chromatiales bacterium]
MSTAPISTPTNSSVSSARVGSGLVFTQAGVRGSGLGQGFVPQRRADADDYPRCGPDKRGPSHKAAGQSLAWTLPAGSLTDAPAATITRVQPIITTSGLTKTYGSGLTALHPINLEIRRGEIFALLGPNGAGKTTLISILCGIVVPGGGQARVDGHDIVRDYRAARRVIGLVPQELHTDVFETVWDTACFSRGLFDLPPDPAWIERVLRDLSLWNKRHDKIMTLSGGMKRRVLIAKALSHEPRVLFLDEPTAGVDVELRRDMWTLIRRLRDEGVTIILTTHYIAEAEEMADRVGVIHRGRLVLVEDKMTLMRKLGRRQLRLHLQDPLREIPPPLADWPLELGQDGSLLCLTFEAGEEQSRIPALLRRLGELGIEFRDLDTRESSLEEIFVGLVKES